MTPRTASRTGARTQNTQKPDPIPNHLRRRPIRPVAAKIRETAAKITCPSESHYRSGAAAHFCGDSRDFCGTRPHTTNAAGQIAYTQVLQYDSNEVAVRVHLVPGIGRHRLDRVEPEHPESLYRRMQKSGSKAGTAHQAHRTIRTALGETVTARPRGKDTARWQNATGSLEEVQCRLLEVNKRRGSARWMPALALGLRQGETLGLRWSDVDLDNEYLKLRRNRLRPKYDHGSGEATPCGRKAGYCPDQVQVRRETKNTKSKAGRRAVPLPGPLVIMLRSHEEEQARERKAAGNLWTESEYVFTKPLGRPLSPNTDYHDWKRLLEDAQVPDGRLHGARHPAATVLMLLGVPDRVIDQIMGWQPGRADASAVPARAGPSTQGGVRKIGTAIWGAPETALGDKNQDNEG